MAFDNEQKGQKNYLDRGNNTVIFNTVTSFVTFNFDSTDKIQVLENPWLHKTLNSIQIQELFDLTPAMQNLLDEELHDHLSIILDEASAEKKRDTNLIDSLVAECNGVTGRQKKCNVLNL
jgi:hypothetical protein